MGKESHGPVDASPSPVGKRHLGAWTQAPALEAKPSRRIYAGTALRCQLDLVAEADADLDPAALWAAVTKEPDACADGKHRAVAETQWAR